MMVTYSYNFHKDRISIEFFMLLLHVFKDSDWATPGILFFSLDRLRNQKPVRLSVSKEREDYRT